MGRWSYKKSMGIKNNVFYGLLLFAILLTPSIVSADNNIYSNENYNRYNLYNATNITAVGFYGSGAGLTNVNVSGVETDPIFLSQNTTIWNAIISKLNSTQVNQTIDARVNAAFVTALGFFSGNHTQISEAYTDTQLLKYYTKTQVDANLSNYLLLTDQRYNESSLILTVNTTGNIQALGFFNITQINSFNASWTATFNTTYQTILNQQCAAGYAIIQIQTNGTILCGQAGQPWNITGSNYLLNVSNILSLNETKLNLTIDKIANNNYLNKSGSNANQNIGIGSYNITLGSLFATFIGSFSSPSTIVYATTIQAVNGNFTQNLTIGTKICFNGDLCSVSQYWNGTALITG